MLSFERYEMSIGQDVGAVSHYLKSHHESSLQRVRSEVEKQLQKFPRLRKFANASLEGITPVCSRRALRELGYRYFVLRTVTMRSACPYPPGRAGLEHVQPPPCPYQKRPRLRVH